MKNFKNSILLKVLPRLSRIALEREKKKIPASEKYFFLGIYLGCLTIAFGSCRCQFKVVSGGPRLLVSLGVGTSPGLNSSIFFYSVTITEDNRIIYSQDPNLEIINKDCRVSYELKLSHPVLLKNNSLYNFHFLYQGISFYAIKKSLNIIEADGLKIDFFEELPFYNLFYLRLD